jgi:cytochrome c oxidase subunit III
MAAEFKIVEEAKKPLAMNPKKFALWLFIVTVAMLFGAFTSAYIVKRADTGWAEITLPWHFTMNSWIIVLSSISLVFATRAAKQDKLELTKVLVSLTAILGLAFLAGQFLAFGELVNMNEHFTGGNVSHSFIYVITGVHAVHVIGGVVFLLITLVAAFRYQVHGKQMDLIEMCSTYWHFLGVLWLYLFMFLMVNP